MKGIVTKLLECFFERRKINVVQPDPSRITGIGLSSRGFVAPLKKLNLLGEFIDFKHFIANKDKYKNETNLLLNLPPWGPFDKELFPSVISCYVAESNKMAPRQAEFLQPCKAIWTPTSFCKKVLKRHGLKSTVLPYCMEYPTRERVEECEESFTFLVSFDGKFSYIKKGIVEAITAFKMAFPKNGKTKNIKLKIKTFEAKETTREAILKEIRNDPRIHLYENKLENFEELYDNVSCYVSLHKGEGFGRHIAESMLRNLPVVLSAYGGPLDYADEKNTILVKEGVLSRHDLVCPQYTWDGEWFDADIESAAAAMKKAFEMNKEEKKRMTEAAAISINQKYSVDAVAEQIRNLWSII